MSGEASPVVSVVIVTWNSRRVVADCLESLRVNPPSVPWEAVVVDNASTDGTVSSIRAVSPWTRVIANSSNRGLPAANNQGIGSTTGEYVLIANPDIVLKPGAVDALRDLLERHPNAAFAIPRLLYEDGSVQTSAGDLPTLAAALLGRQVQRKLGARSDFWWDGWAHDEERSIGRGQEACYLVRRRAIEDFGLQDEAFFLDWEGPDWTARARSSGWEVWFTPDAEVFHAGGASIRQVPYGWIYHSHRGMYRYFAKRRPAWQRPLIALLVAARMAAKVVAQALSRPTGKSMYGRGHGSGNGAGP